MSVAKRLEIFIRTCFECNDDFAKAASIKYSILKKVLTERYSPDMNILMKFNKIGLSIDWLFEGIGSMFASNPAGNLLKNQATCLQNSGYSSISDRLIYWIINNYGSIRNFASIMKLDYEYLYGIIYNDMIPDAGLFRALRAAGCNIDWLNTGQGKEYDEIKDFKIISFEKEDIETLPRN